MINDNLKYIENIPVSQRTPLDLVILGEPNESLQMAAADQLSTANFVVSGLRQDNKRLTEAILALRGELRAAREGWKSTIDAYHRMQTSREGWQAVAHKAYCRVMDLHEELAAEARQLNASDEE
jgi:hypothetical protein